MSKTIKLSESELTNIIKKILEEQSVSNVMQTSKPNKTSMSSSQGSFMLNINKGSAKDWFKYFPCLNVKNKNIFSSGDKMILKQGATQIVLLPMSGRDDSSYSQSLVNEPHNGYVGKIQSGGVYFCPSNYPEGLITLSTSK